MPESMWTTVQGAGAGLTTATASATNHRFPTELGAVPTTDGAGLVDRVATLAPGGADGSFADLLPPRRPAGPG